MLRNPHRQAELSLTEGMQQRGAEHELSLTEWSTADLPCREREAGQEGPPEPDSTTPHSSNGGGGGPGGHAGIKRP